MKAFMERVVALEDQIEATGTFVFGGALHDPDASPVLRASEGDFSHDRRALRRGEGAHRGFYIINADDLDAALAWGRTVVDAIQHPIEVRPFRATGRVQRPERGSLRSGSDGRGPLRC